MGNSADFTIQVGEYRSRPYFISIRADPDFENTTDFAVSLYYNDRYTEGTVEIARIDTAHGFTHIDREYHREQPTDPIFDDLPNEQAVWKAQTHLDENWRDYAKRYERNHDE